MNTPIYTLGHSTHSTEKFIELLTIHAINAVCDVRSVPFSKYTPCYNKDNLKQILHHNHIKYVFLGKELGARPDNPNCYKNGKVQFDLVAQTDMFHNGLSRLIQGTQHFKIALVCAEKDPSQCHRTILIANALRKKGVCVHHILEDGVIITQETLEGQKNYDLFAFPS